MDCNEDICEEASLPKFVYKAGQRFMCPPTKESIGRCGWSLLHTIAAHYPDDPTDDWKEKHEKFFRSFGKVYPCKPCGRHFAAAVKAEPPKLENREAVSVWVCEMHNRVNEMLNKPIFACDLSTLDERWRKGKPPCTSTINGI